MSLTNNLKSLVLNRFKLGDVKPKLSIIKHLMILALFRLAKALACNLVKGRRAEPKLNEDVHQLKETKKKMILIVIGE